MGRFLPGHAKLGGKVKGSKNKKTNLLAKCEAKGIDLFEEALTGVMTEQNPDKRFEKIVELLPYVYARQKEVSHTLEDYSDEEFDKEVERRLSERRPSAKVSER